MILDENILEKRKRGRPKKSEHEKRFSNEKRKK